MVDVGRTRERLARAVTANDGVYVSALLDQRAAGDVHAVTRTLQRLRATLATSREATAIDPARNVRLRVEWVDDGARLLLVMGEPR